MANDIKKQLVIKATLDSAALKKEIATLKNELKAGLSLSSQDTTSIKNEFKNIAKGFAEELKKAVQGSNMSVGGGGSSGRRSSRRHSMLGEDYDINRDSSRQEARRMAKQEKLADQARNKELREQARISQTLEKINQKSWDQHDKELAASIKEKLKGIELEKREKEKLSKIQQRDHLKLESQKEKDRKKDLDQNIKNLETLRQKRLEQATENSKLDRSAVASIGRTVGMSPEDARELAKKSNRVNAGSISSGMGAAGTVITGTVLGLHKLRTMDLERKQRFAQDIESGDYIGAQATQFGRDENSPTKWGLAAGGAAVGAATGAKVGAFLGIPGMLALGAIGGVAGGIGGYMTGSNLQGDWRNQEVAPLSRSFQYAKSLNPSRLNALQGGGINSSDLTSMQSTGNRNAFSPEETLSQFTQARGFLGNQGAKDNLAKMQDISRATGMDVGSQASVIETFAGTGQRGQGFARAATQQTQIIERAISAGLDRSKTSQFMRTTADYVQSSAGFGRVDTGGISNRMIDMAQGFAAGGPITSQAMQQAQSLSELSKSESISTTGFAGIGNITAIQDVLGKDATPGQIMAAMNLSQDATVEDTQKALGITKEQAQQLVERKRNNLNEGLKLAGIDPDSSMGLAFGAYSQGITTEQRLGVRDAQSSKPSLNVPVGIESMRKEVIDSKEGQMAKVESRISQERFEQGFSAFDDGIRGAAQGLVELTKVFLESQQAFKKMISESSRTNLTKGPVK
jgi:hypothetical protein